MHELNPLREAFVRLFPDAGSNVAGGAELPPAEPKKLDFVPLLSNGGCVVVVGGRAANYSEKMRRHPQFRLWLETTDKAPTLPSNAKAVLNTRWQRHSHENGVRGQAKNRGVFCPPGHYDPSAINDAFDRFVAHQKATQKPEAEPVVAEAPKQLAPPPAPPQPVVHEEQMPKKMLRGPKPGELLRFVMEHGNVDAPVQIEEARRLTTLMADEGILTTASSVAQTLWRKRMAMRGDKVVAPRAEIITPLIEEPPPPPVKPLPTADLLANVLEVAESALADSKLALQAAEHGLAEIKTCNDVLTDTVAKVREELQRFREQQRMIRQVAQQAAAYLD